MLATLQERRKKRLLVSILCIALVAPRLASISAFATIDEHEWLVSSLNFSHALARRDFRATYRWEHPGVTTMWVGAAAYLLQCPECLDTTEVQSQDYEAYLVQYETTARVILTISRTLMVLIETSILLIVYRISQHLLGTEIALVGTIFIALDPFVIAHTQLLHLDGLLSTLLLLTLLAFIRYLDSRRVAHLVLSGVAAGLVWLTKSVGIFIVPAIIAVALADAAKAHRHGPKLRQHLISLLAWGLIAGVVFAILWPAMWVAPVETVNRMKDAALSYAEQGHESPVFFQGRIHSDGRLGGSFYPLSYLWRSSPVVLLGLGLALASRLSGQWRPGPAAGSTHTGLLIFALLYMAQLSLGYKKFDRYLLPIHLPMMLVSAYGWEWLVSHLSKSVSARRRYHRHILVLVVIGLHASSLVWSFPYHLTYYNPLLGGLRGATNAMTVGWGEGLDRAAAYLAEKPDADKLRVASWYSPCFSYFFPGDTLNIDNATDLSMEHVDFLLSADYLIIYVHQWQRGIPRSLIERIQSQQPEHIIHIRGVPYVHIYRLRIYPKIGVH